MANVKYYNLTGGLNTVQGIGTINQSNKRTESPDMQNIEYYKLGGLQSMDGNQQFANVLPSSITLGYEYIYGNNKYMIICTSDGTVYRYDRTSNTFVEIYEFENPTERHSICSFNNGIVISNGVDDLVYYQYGRNQLLNGTVSITNGSNAITGTNTTFTTDLAVGDYIKFGDIDKKYKVEDIDDDTHLTLSEAVYDFQSQKTFYAWSDGTQTLYTDTLDNSNQVNVYEIIDNVSTIVYTNGVIVDNQLIISQTSSTTITETGYKDWAFNTSYGNISGSNIWGNNLASVGLNSTISTTWTFPNKMKFRNFGYTIVFAAHKSTMIIRVYIDGILQRSKSYTNYTSNDSIDLGNIEGQSIKIEVTNNFNAGVNICTIAAGTLSAQESYTYQSTQEVTTNITANRDTENDKTIEVATTNIQYYLTDISELNAVYTTTSDKNISKSIRGLALNSYQGRIFVGSNDGTLYYSGVGLIHGWNLENNGAGAIPTFYDDNSDFTALGLWDKYLVICKRERSYILDGTNANDQQWTLNPYSDYTCDSQQSWLVANNSFLVYSRTAGGIYPLLQRTIYNPNYQGVDISTKIRDSFYNLNESKFPFIFPVYHPRKKYIMFYMPFTYGIGSNYCYIFDLQTKTWLLRVVPQDVTCAFRYDNKIYIGTRTGKILEEFKNSTFDGDPIEWYYKTPWFMFGQGTDYLSTREFRINMSEDSMNKFRIGVRRDGKVDVKYRNIDNKIGTRNSLVWNVENELDSLTDTTWDNDSWLTTSHVIKRLPLPNQYFQSLQLEFSGKGLDEGMRIYGFEIDGVQLEEVPWS